MAGNEELMMRLQQLENGYYGDKEKARQDNFFSTYGSRFSNNRGLGLAILNELDARGIDTSAADEAVTQIIDQLRTECNEIIEALKEVQSEAIEQAQKVEEIGNVVSEAVASNPDASLPPAPDASAEMPTADLPPDMQDADQLNMEAFAEEPAGDVPPEAAEEPAEPAEEPTEEPAEPPAEEPTEEPAPDTTVSDARMKRIRGAYDAIHAKRASNSFKPSAGILSACQGGH